MNVFKVEFKEETTNEVTVFCQTKKQATQIVNSGIFDSDEVIDRDHFEITNCYYVGKEK